MTKGLKCGWGDMVHLLIDFSMGLLDFIVNKI